MFTLNRTIARNARVNLNDTVNTKFALIALGYHDDTETGLSPYADNSFFESIKKFQKDHDLTIDGIMKPLGETIAKMNEKLKENTGFIGAFQHFRDNFDLMNEAKTYGADKYFHCKANYEASRRGWSGKHTAETMSDLKEIKDIFYTGHPLSDSVKDQKANLHGREAAESGKFSSAREACEIYRPKNLDEKY